MGNFTQNCNDCFHDETSPTIPTITDFQIIKQIGEGAFSYVYLVKKKDTNTFFALKVMSKAEIIQKNLKVHIERESAILQEVEHPFLIILNYAFQTQAKLYLALEFMQGGQLFQHLQKFKQNEKMIKFYAAEIVLALEYLHEKQILYRDLKPENILFGIDGHIKLTDFGLSKKGYGKTICGSEFYLAPEILKSKYRRRNKIIINCFKIKQQNRQQLLIGELLAYCSMKVQKYNFFQNYCELVMSGKLPYVSQDLMLLLQEQLNVKLFLLKQIQNLQKQVQYPPEIFSREAKSLISGLLEHDPQKRLGSVGRGVMDIKFHKFFNGIDWIKIFQKQITPPLSLSARNDLDLQYFPKVYQIDLREKPETNIQISKSQEHFKNYNYARHSS